MRKIYLGVLAVALLIVIPAVVFANGGSSGEAEAEPPTDIEANFWFDDDGSTLTITGEGEGFEPGHLYISLIYDVGSSDEGIFACEPTIFNPKDDNYILDTMFVGIWDVDDLDGTATLAEVNIENDLGGPRVHVPLSKIGTISVRGGDEGPLGGPPVILCGEVESDDDD